MSRVDKLNVIFADQQSAEFAVFAKPGFSARVEDATPPLSYDRMDLRNDELSPESPPRVSTRTIAASWSRLSRGLARGKAHWCGPRYVNLATVGPSFIADGEKTRVGGAVPKRVLDLAASLLILVLASPILLCTAIAVRLESRGPILYKQTRVGRHGVSFIIYKFRTMRVDAEGAAGPQWASLHDPRVTRIGSFLRRMRIDELPQLINVIKGEMSVVGPRPERPFFVQSLAKEIPSYAQRHHARPGITGWAQINRPYGASTEDAKEKLAYDLYYLKNSNFIFDLLILLSTPKAVLIGRGGR